MTMRETTEFRIVERFAPKLFKDAEGKKLGFIRKVELSTDDPRYERIGELNKEIRETTDSAFFLVGMFAAGIPWKSLQSHRAFTRSSQPCSSLPAKNTGQNTMNQRHVPSAEPVLRRSQNCSWICGNRRRAKTSAHDCR